VVAEETEDRGERRPRRSGTEQNGDRGSWRVATEETEDRRDRGLRIGAFCVGETAFWVVRKFVVVRACFIIEFVVGRGSLVVVVRAPCVGETACVWSRRGVRRRL